MGFYVPGGHIFCIHGEALFLHVLCHGILVFFDKLRLHNRRCGHGDRHLHISVDGVHGFLGMIVSAVIDILVPVIVLGITEFLTSTLPRRTDIMLRMTALTSVPSLIQISFFSVIRVSFLILLLLRTFVFSCHNKTSGLCSFTLHQSEGLHKF